MKRKDTENNLAGKSKATDSNGINVFSARAALTFSAYADERVKVL